MFLAKDAILISKIEMQVSQKMSGNKSCPLILWI